MWLIEPWEIKRTQRKYWTINSLLNDAHDEEYAVDLIKAKWTDGNPKRITRQLQIIQRRNHNVNFKYERQTGPIIIKTR